MNAKVSIVIIGGGALGLAVANCLLDQGQTDFVLLEKNDAFGLEQSGSNSGVIHAGFLYKTGSLMARFCVEGTRLLYEFCEKYHVPYKKTGKLMVATNVEQEKILKRYFKRAAENGLQEIEIISGKHAKRLEPCVEAKAALYVGQSGVFDASFFVSILYKRAAAKHENADMLMKNCKVVGIESKKKYFILDVEQVRGDTQRWQIDCDILINAAGLYSLEIARMIDPHLPFEKQYLRGEYYQFNSRSDLFIDMNIYPTPVLIKLPGAGQFLDLGAHLTPKVGPDGRGNTLVAKETLVGPIFTETNDPEDYRSTLDVSIFFDSVKLFFPSLKKEELYKGHTGILGLIKDQTDFIIFRDKRYPNSLHLLGMESPALTASLAIAKHVVDLIID
jgi:L-2-hydroxyglutarate oxidase LhgO